MEKSSAQRKVYQSYGPTEAMGMSCYYVVDRVSEEDDAIPIGRPLRIQILFC